MAKKNVYIHELEIKMKEFKKDSILMKERLLELEEENKDLSNGNPKKKKQLKVIFSINH